MRSDAGFRRSQTTHIALQRLRDAGVIARPDADLLISAERLWRTIQDMLRMTVGRLEAAALPLASALPLLRATAKAGAAATDADALLRTSDGIARQVRMIFERYVGKPDQ